jgi:hypothetical protein
MVSSSLLQASASLALVVADKPVSIKRGLGAYTGGWNVNWTCEDGALLGLDNSWHYSWAANPSQYTKCKGQNISAEFVPMINGINQAQSMLGTPSHHYITEWTEHNVHFLLGYNEPDMGNGKAGQHPHQCTPADAAKDWPALQQLAALFDPPLELVAPAVSSVSESGGTDAWDDNGHSTWLDEFFGNCTDVVEECDPSLIKYIAMHDYHGDVKQLQKRASGARQRYGDRQLWLTEFAHTQWGSAPTREEQDAYLTEVLPYLDGSDDVFRYAWYSTRNQPNAQNGGSNLLEVDGSASLTSTGRIYSGQSFDTVMV